MTAGEINSTGRVVDAEVYVASRQEPADAICNICRERFPVGQSYRVYADFELDGRIRKCRFCDVCAPDQYPAIAQILNGIASRSALIWQPELIWPDGRIAPSTRRMALGSEPEPEA